MYDSVFVVTSLANLAAGYNLAVAGHVLYLIEAGEAGQEVSETETGLVASAAFIGAVIGQLSLGWLGEVIGVTKGLVLTFVVLVLGALAGAFLCWNPNLLEKLAFTRFIVGFGAGGVYPLAAIASAEKVRVGGTKEGEQEDEEEFDGRRVMLTFSFQGVGQLIAPLWVLVLDALLPHSRNVAWRVALLSGSIPAGFAIGRTRQVLDEMLTGEVADVSELLDDDEEVEEQMAAPRDTEMAQDVSFRARWTPKNIMRLVGTGGTWFLFDVIFYGNIVFSPFVLKGVFDAAPAKIAGLTTVLSCIALPGLYLASYKSNSMGRKRMQILGFSVLAMLYLFLSILNFFGEGKLPALVFILYAATFFFFNFGPNATTFCLPAETFDKSVRSFFNGISAACGKAGAVLGASFFKFLLDSTSLGFVMMCSMFISILAALMTIFFVEGKHDHGVSEFQGTELVTRMVSNESFHDNESVDVPSRYPRMPALREGSSEMANI